MNQDTVLSRSEDYISNEIDGEIVMMNIETGTYVSLNATGKSVWDLIEEPKVLNDIIEALVIEYSIDKETCVADLAPFIQQMLDQKIILSTL